MEREKSIEPITKNDMYLSFLSGNKDIVELPTPVTRKEIYLAKLCGMEIKDVPTPITREDMYLYDILSSGEGENNIVVEKQFSNA